MSVRIPIPAPLPKALASPIHVCDSCGEWSSDMQRTGDRGWLCDDCYFDELGNLVEQHPIGGLR
jgi:hypothetical protein